MICHKCGKEVTDESTSCQFCNASFSEMLKPGEPAGFWRRWLAMLVDSNILLIVIGLILLAAKLSGNETVWNVISIIFIWTSTSQTGDYTQTIWYLCPYLSLAGLVYFTLFHSLNNGQTIGKRLLNIRVTKTSGQPIGFFRAFLRWIGYGINFCTLLLGYIPAAIPPAKRAVHDYIFGTKVVYVGNKPVSKWRAVIIALIVLGGLFVLIIFGIILAIAFPNFIIAKNVQIVRTSTVAMNQIQQAVASYELEQGRYPERLENIAPQFMSEIPELTLPNHPKTRQVTPIGVWDIVQDSGTWGYSKETGQVSIQCTCPTFTNLVGGSP